MLLVAGMPLLTNAQVITKVNDVAPFQEGLAGVQKGNAWGFIDADGKLIVDYRTDLVLPPNGKPVFSDGMCMIKEEKDGLILFGYIDTRGRTAIPAEYLAATPFENGYARVIKYYKEDTGTTNALGKNIVNYSYNELLINPKNQTVQHLRGPNRFLFDKTRLRDNPPPITSFFIGDALIAVKEADNTYSVYRVSE